MQQPQPDSGLGDHLGVLRRHTLLVVAVTVMVTAAAASVTASGGERHKALAEVLLSRQDVANQITGLATPSPAGEFARITSTQAGIASTPRVARDALALAGVSDMTPDQFLENSGVDVKPNTDILQFTVEDTSPQRAVKLVNGFARAYVDYRRLLDTSPITEARQQAQRRIKALEANGDRKSSLYSALVDKDQQLSTAEALQGANATITRAAETAGQVAPRIRRNIILGVLVGLILGVATAFLTEAFDTRVRSADEVRDGLGIPLLGVISAPSRALREANDLIMLRSPNGPSAEAFRLLRTNLSFANLERQAKTILVTSAVTEEGKSTTVSNLAVTLSRAGAQVILVDLDLRRPTVARLFHLGPHAGITDVALGAVGLDEALQDIDFEIATITDTPFAARDIGTLRVLTGGLAPPDIGEFLGGKALASILKLVRERADFVLIDSPPILGVGDALAVSGSVDAMLVIARIDKLRRTMVRQLNDLLVAAPVPKLGLIATGGSESSLGYGYRYSYGRRDPKEDQVDLGTSPPRQKTSAGS